MKEIHIQSASLVAMIASLPLISWGSTEDVVAATTLGAVLLALGLVALTALRFVDLGEDA